MITTITLPQCKSIIIRRMIYQFVLNGEVLDVEDGSCNDVLVTHRALLRVKEASALSALTTVDVEDCGAAYRFLLAVLSVTRGRWLLTGTPRLLLRPVKELAEVLSTAGACLRRVEQGWFIEGRCITSDSLTINGARSSQFVSALLLIAPKIGLRSLRLDPPNIGSVPYVQLTRLCIDSQVDMPQLPPPPVSLGGVGDWSAALFWYAKARLSPERILLLRNLSLSSAQGDAVTAAWFAQLGVESKETTEGIIVRAVRPCENRTFLFDVEDHPDVVPVMAALACLLPADFIFLNTRNLAYKESDRVRRLAEQLSPFAVVDTKENSFHIVGRDTTQWPTKPWACQTYQDHRIAMAFLLFGKRVVLDDVTCLRKSYPGLTAQLSLLETL